jgi:hypothetical protein
LTNHSCDPSCYTQLSVQPPSALNAAQTATASLIARRSIAAAERLTFDYVSTEWDMAAPFDCACGAASCRGRIAGFRYLTAEQKASLQSEGALAAHVQAAWDREQGHS